MSLQNRAEGREQSLLWNGSLRTLNAVLATCLKFTLPSCLKSVKKELLILQQVVPPSAEEQEVAKRPKRVQM